MRSDLSARRVAQRGVFVWIVILAAALGSPSGAATKRPASPRTRRVDLQLWTYNAPGDTSPGLEEQANNYATGHPGVAIRIVTRNATDHHRALEKALAGGPGPDIAVVDSDMLAQLATPTNGFADLVPLGAARFERNYLAWRWDQGVSVDRTRVVALPADLGGLVLAYRPDVFAKSGAVKDNAEMTRRASSWEGLVDLCAKVVATMPAQRCLDSGTTVFNALKNQGTERYIGSAGEVVYDRNPQIRRAWDLAARAIRTGLTANVEFGTPEWTNEFARGGFAAAVIPLSQVRAIESRNPAGVGLWDVVGVPGGGAVGGRHVAVLSRTRSPEEAFVVQTIVSPETQLALFKQYGSFPSTPSVYELADVQNFKSSYFTNASVGRLAADAAKALRPYRRGPDDARIDQAFVDGLARVAQGSEDPEGAWASTLRNIADASKRR